VFVARRHLLALLVLSLVWGASFLFIKIAVRELSPASLILGRLGSAALTLAIVVPLAVGLRTTLAALRANAGWLFVVAIVNTALPFWLLSWGETRIDSGLASILQASVPIFNAVLSFCFFREVRVTGLRLVGVGLGFLGVALLVGAQPKGQVLGALAVVGMALCYALGALLAGRHLSGVSPLVVSLAATGISTLAVLPAGVAQAPAELPSWKTIGAVLFLGVPGTAFAFLLMYGLIARAGAAFVSLVTYLIPPIALAYGAIFLDERFGSVEFGSLALILGGVALGTGTLRLRRRRRLASAA
jgi:drug/metabolite transporter (DMT)-like permease